MLQMLKFKYSMLTPDPAITLQILKFKYSMLTPVHAPNFEIQILNVDTRSLM